MQGPGFNPTPQPPAGNAVVEALKDKTVCYAIIGKTVILSSSKASLQSAMAAYRGQGKTLADDPAYATMQAKLTPQSQAFALIDIGKICDALRPTLEAGLKQSDIKANDILGIFGDGKMGIMSSGRYDGKLFKGSATLPLDYAKLIRLIGKVLDLAPSSPPGARGRM
jgi:hypothetical protein